MRITLLIMLGSLAGLVATLDVAGASPAAATGTYWLAQNTGAADRSLGNGSMGLGEGIERLPDPPEAGRDDKENQPVSRAYDETEHGDTHPDMEHRPRRTLGDRDDD